MDILAKKGLPKVAAPPPAASDAAEHDHPAGRPSATSRPGDEPAEPAKQARRAAPEPKQGGKP